MLKNVTEINTFESQRLPTCGQVIGRIYSVFEQLKEEGQRAKLADAIRKVANELELHWINRNVYPNSVTAINKQLTYLIEGIKTVPGYSKIRSFPSSKRHTSGYKANQSESIKDI